MKAKVIYLLLVLLLVSGFLSAQNNDSESPGYYENMLDFLHVIKKSNTSAFLKNANISEKRNITSEAVNTQDSLALLDLYRHAVGPNNEEVINQLVQYPVYTWLGIEIENRRVVEIDLSDKDLSGTIPSTIGNITELKTLVLASNSLSGNIPDEICNLKKLENLDLSENNLTGNIPSEIGNLVNLKGHAYWALCWNLWCSRFKRKQFEREYPFRNWQFD